MKSLPILLVSLLAAQPALALSCRVPDVERTSRDAMEADASYRIAVGTFSYRSVTPPAEGTPGEDGEAMSIPAQFEGKGLTSTGFDDAIEDDVILNITCMTGSCGSVEPGVETLVFLRQEDEKAVLDLDPCPNWVFPRPTDAQLDTVRECVTGEGCPAD